MINSHRSDLLRKFYKLMIDNHLTPYILLDTQCPYVEVPRQYVKEDGTITLNISSNAILNLKIDTTAIEFEASFNGNSQTIYAPIQAVLAIYAQENGTGMVFPEKEKDKSDGGTTTSPPRVRPGTKPKLFIVK